jgi:hypothetical protein
MCWCFSEREFEKGQPLARCISDIECRLYVVHSSPHPSVPFSSHRLPQHRELGPRSDAKKELSRPIAAQRRSPFADEMVYTFTRFLHQ